MKTRTYPIDPDAITVTAKANGWHVVLGDRTLGPFACNADAWRALDRISGNAVSPAEQRAQYPWQKLGDLGD